MKKFIAFLTVLAVIISALPAVVFAEAEYDANILYVSGLEFVNGGVLTAPKAGKTNISCTVEYASNGNLVCGYSYCYNKNSFLFPCCSKIQTFGGGFIAYCSYLE